MPDEKWKNIVNLDNLEFKEGSLGEHFKWKTSPSLSDMLGAKKLGFHVESLLPKKFTCPYHFHHSEEELFLVLTGKAMLRQNSEFREVSAGDLIFFVNGPEGAHQFYNHSSEPFLFLALSTMDDFEVCEYPDSKKVFVAKIKKVFLKEQATEYIKGEEDPRLFWPEEHLKSF